MKKKKKATKQCSTHLLTYLQKTHLPHFNSNLAHKQPLRQRPKGAKEEASSKSAKLLSLHF